MNRSREIGRRIGRYTLLEEIGRGGMATVYRARDELLERDVALKLLHPHLASHTESRKRFSREAKAVAKLRHPSVLEIYDYSGEDGGDDSFIVMELVEGPNLRTFLDERAGSVTSAEAAALIMRRVASALAHAHANGIIHRDVKPENILIGPKGRIKLSDFGIAHLTGLSEMTTTGQILGSPAYMSPEHIEHPELDARADIFSCGTVLYELVTGRTPFTGTSPHLVIKNIVEGNYIDPLRINPAVGHDVAGTLTKCLEKDPNNRYDSAQALVADLESALERSGLSSFDDELSSYFQDPDGWTHGHAALIVERTLEAGLEARGKKRTVEAINHFNRVLALEPGNEKALASVSGLTLQKKFRRVFDKAAVIVPLLVAALAVGWGLLRNDPDAAAQAVVVPRSPDALPIFSTTHESAVAKTDPGGAISRHESATNSPPKGMSDASDASFTETEEGTEAEIAPPRRLQRPQRPSSAHRDTARRAAKRDVIFTPHPMSVTIVIDGKEKFAFGPSERRRQLAVGRHTITFVPNDPRRFEKKTRHVDIPPGDKPFHIRERLDWKPAELLVSSNVDTLVTVPGHTTGRTNQPFEIAIKSGPKNNVSIVISADGYVTQTRRASVEAGERTSVRADLAPKDRSGALLDEGG